MNWIPKRIKTLTKMVSDLVALRSLLRVSLSPVARMEGVSMVLSHRQESGPNQGIYPHTPAV